MSSEPVNVLDTVSRFMARTIDFLDKLHLLPGSNFRLIKSVLSLYPTCLEAPLVRRSVALGDVPKWDEFGAETMGWPRIKAGQMSGWGRRDGEYKGLSIDVPELASLISREQSTGRFDIRMVEGMSNSKSELTEYVDLDKWALDHAEYLTQEVTTSALEELWKWDEIRIKKDHTGDFLVHHEFDGRYFLVNSGGSHHFAAARYVSGQLNYEVVVSSVLYSYKVNWQALVKLEDKFRIYAVKADSAFRNALFQVFKACEVTHYWREMPQGMSGHPQMQGLAPEELRLALFLPRASKRSEAAISAFDAAGAVDVLAELRSQCRKAEERQGVRSKL